MLPNPGIQARKQMPRWRDRLTGNLRKGQETIEQQIGTNQAVQPTHQRVPHQTQPPPHTSSVGSTPAATGSSQSSNQSGDGLWSKAYAAKKAQCPKLLQDYEAILCTELGTSNVSDSEVLQRLVDRQVEKLESQRWKLQLGQHTLVVREQVGRLVKAVTYAKDYVQTIATSDPHAGLAWAGISVFLPLLCGPIEQDEALTEGLDEVCSILYRFAVLERLYTEYSIDPAVSRLPDIEKVRSNFEKSAVKVLAGVVEFQARVTCYCDRNNANRYWRDVWKADDWLELSKQIRQDNARCQGYVETIQAEDFDNRMNVQAHRLHHISTDIDDILGLTRKTLPEIRAEFAKLRERLSAEQVHKCLEALWTSNYENHKRVVGEAVPGTCKWFTSHEQYLAWKQSPSDDVLWLSADPGCGKSVLVRHLVENDLSTHNCTVGYCFFRAGNIEQTRLDVALSAQLHQLLTQNRHLIRHAMPRYNAKGKAFSGSVKDLWSTIMDAIEDSTAGEIIIIFDALDECDRNDCRDLIRLVSRFRLETTSSTRKSRLKILLTSRPYHAINKEFHELLSMLPNVHLSADKEAEAITQEINLVIDFRMLQIRQDLALSEATMNSLIHKLKGVGNRTYLWLTLILDVIEDRLETSTKKLSKLVDELPSTIYQAYQAILARSIDLAKARKIFSALLAGQRPFSIGEMSRIVEIDETTCSEDDLEPEPDHIFRDKIRYICGLFVVVIEDKVFFLHETVREFLATAGTRGPDNGLQSFPLPLSVRESHLSMLALCSQTVLHESRRKNIRDNYDWLLLTYVATFWDRHHDKAMRLEILEPDITHDTATKIYDLTENALNCDQTTWTHVLRLCQLIRVWWVYRKHRVLQTDPALWPITVALTCFGFDRLLDHYLKNTRDPEEVNNMDCRGRTALSWACTLGRTTIVKVLLSRNAAVDYYITVGRSPLTSAASPEVRSLLETHRPRSSLSEKERCKQVLKSEISKTTCVLVPELRVLQDDRVYSQAEDGFIVRKLTSHQDLRKLLQSQRLTAMPSSSPSYKEMLDYIENQDLESLNETIVADDLNLLCLAASERRLDLLEILIARGVDVHQCGIYNGRDALSYAAESGSPECVRFLLNQGASVHRFDTRGRNSLAHALASHARDKGIAVRVLLEAENDIDGLIQKLRHWLANPREFDIMHTNSFSVVSFRQGIYVDRLHDDGTRTHLGRLASDLRHYD